MTGGAVGGGGGAMAPHVAETLDIKAEEEVRSWQ
jgi:hypothetical protein